MTVPRRMPPLGKALLVRGPGLVLIVPSTLAGWRTARIHPPGDVLVLQLGHDPGLYDWSVVRDCEVVLYTEVLDVRTVDRMVRILELAGATVSTSDDRSCHTESPR